MIITTDKQPFVANAVFIPADQEEDADPDACTKLMVNGDNNDSDVFTEDSWNDDGEPFCHRTLGRFTAVEGGRVELLPVLWIIKIDERAYWLDQEILEACPRLYGVYVFDRRKHFHLCSFTPCYELHFIGTQYEETPDLLEDDCRQDEVNHKVLEGDLQTEQVAYRSSTEIDRMLTTEIVQGCLPPDSHNGGYRLEGIESISSEEAIEEASEIYATSEL